MQQQQKPGGEPPRPERSLYDALLRFGGFGDDAIALLCEQLDLGMLRDRQDDAEFLENLAGSEWAFGQESVMKRLVTNIHLICDPNWVEEEKGVVVPAVRELVAEAEARKQSYWPYSSFQPAVLCEETVTKRKERSAAKKKKNMRKFKVFSCRR